MRAGGVARPPARPIKLNANDSHLPLRTILKCERFSNANDSQMQMILKCE
jgi:hypothetical protein